MRGIIKKVSYITVLLAMALYVGLRFVPHHHCGCETVQTLHIGFGECGECQHEDHDGCDHSNEAELCCNDVEFCRCADDDNFAVKKLCANDFMAFIHAEPDLAKAYVEPCRYSVRELFAVPEAHCRGVSLRAPPVL